MTTRVATWNMQGAGNSDSDKWAQGVRDVLLCRLQAQVVCLQECGRVPADVQSDGWFQIRNPLRQWGNVMSYSWTTPRAGTVYITHLENNGKSPWASALGLSDEEKGRFRCNLAIVSVERPSRVVQVWSAGTALHRPAVGAQFSFGWVFSLHAMSGNGNDAPGLVASARGTAGASDWIIGGDFNCEPGSPNAQRIRTFHEVLSSGYITRPLYGKKELDYFVAKAPGRKPRVEYIHLSDHIPVLIDHFG